MFTGVRPARVAVLVNSSDSGWKDTCLRIIEFYTTVWGGKHNIIVPTDGNTISESFWQILEAFDPDYIYRYGKTLKDLKFSDPSAYDGLLTRQVEQFVVDNPGAVDEDVRSAIDESLERQITENFTISRELQDQIRSRLAPLYFEQYVVHAGWIDAATEAHYPLTAISKILSCCEHPTEIAQVNVDIPEIPQLWLAAVTGRLRPSYLGALRALGVGVTEQQLSGDEAVQLFNLGMGRPGNTVTPFDLSMVRLDTYSSRRYQDWQEPVVVVVGGALEDFCLYQCLSRVRYRVAWLPSSLIDLFRTGISRARSGGSLLSGHELHAFHFAHALLDLTRSRGSDRKVVFVSASLEASKIDEYCSSLNEAALGSDWIQARSETRRSILDLLKCPLLVYERGNAGKARTQQFVQQELAGFFETPKPEGFTTIEPHELRWMTEFSVKGHALPRHPELGTFVVRSGALTSQEARVGNYGATYFCPNIMVFSSDIDQVLIKPSVFLPNALDIARYIARTAALSCKISDKGYFLSETMQKFGGVDKLGVFLRGDERRALLDKFLDTNRPLRGTHDEGVYLNSDHRRYLNFQSIRKILNKSEEDVRVFIDDLIQKAVLYRGFIFKCAFCRNADWFSIDEITHEFKCKRCGHVQVYVSEHWREPNEPSWYYKLDEIVYQGYSHNMSVPALALYFLSQKKLESFLYSPELEFFDDNSDVPVAELDLFCIQDGILSIGEAKKEDRLGENASDDRRISGKYHEFAKKLCARKVIFATIAPQWSGRTVEQIRHTFLGPEIGYELLTGAELL
jgi:hypothetical protein